MSRASNDKDFIFARALQKPVDQRGAFLDGACGGDHKLRQQIEELLECHEAAGSFLENPPEALDETAASELISEGRGTVVGPYKLLQQIGEGGFGVVYMAEQTEPVRRQVALKIIKPGMDTREAKYEDLHVGRASRDRSQASPNGYR